ncbi:MAG: ABC transporter ATP-binding protein [Rectinema subterraneum]|uniref:ABC transporter ATP-binding protein n=1 Tax=Rectinema subterraneum TaxID=2653714 RepID=UPI003C7987C3
MLRLYDVHTQYGQVEALGGISLEVHEHSMVALLGANGAGKSTTLMTISGILKPSAGYIEYNNVDIGKLDAREIVELGIIQCPEGRRVFGNLTVKENLRMGAVSCKDKHRLKETFDYVFTIFPILKERISQTASTLSGGEQQMLAIGRALMAKPRVLLLDEPSLGLAPIIVDTIFEVIQRLNQEGVTILLVEQNAHRALEMAHYAYVLEKGRIVMEGPGIELRANPEVEHIYLSEVPEAEK